MKILIYIIPLIFVGFVSCSDFLDYKDKDKVIPDELVQYSELIGGELIDKSSSSACYNVLLMSDDVGTFIYPYGVGEETRTAYFSWYTWAQETQITPEGDEKIDPAWEFLYHKILMCNVIENDVNAFEDDLDGVKRRLLGEVQAIRAMSYWYLVNMFGEPYRNVEQAKTAMGVPVNMESSIIDKIYERESLQTIYDLMEKDLKSALLNLKAGEQKKTIFRPNQDIVRLFLSRIYLEEKRYDDVIAICDTMLKETTKTIVSLNEMKIYASSSNAFLNKNNESMLFTWWTRDAISGFNESYNTARYAPSEDLVALYANGDVRNASNFAWNYDKHLMKFNSNYSGCYGMNYRVEEIYFNRAEAYIESGEWQLGMQDLNKIYAQRVENEYLEAQNVEQARELLRLEKRKEFCFEDIRWFDIRRWGLSVEHKYYDYNNATQYVTYVLEANSPNYILPVPLDVQRRNSLIELPKRVEIKAK